MNHRFILRFGSIPALLLVATFSLWADALDNWTSGKISTNDFGLNGFWLSGVAYGNGRYVAVGQYILDDSGVVETSEDGVNWTMRSHHDISILDLYQVTYANGIFVAVGWDAFSGANIYHSTNGINWTAHATSIANFYGVTYGGGLFVAVGDGNLVVGGGKTNRNIYTSPDGIAWTPRNSGSPVNDVQSIRDVAFGTNRFVAVDDAGNAYTSTTGTTWTRSAAGTYGSVDYCQGRFVSRNSAGSNLVSGDGLSWSLMVKDTTNAFSQIIYTNGLYAALSGTNVYTSTNATNWTRHNLPVPSNAGLTALIAVTFGNRNIVAFGYGGWPYLPAVPAAWVSDPFVSVDMNSGSPPQLSISGLLGRSYRIESADALPGAISDWQTNATVQLSSDPYIWTDLTATNAQRFYRAALLP